MMHVRKLHFRVVDDFASIGRPRFSMLAYEEDGGKIAKVLPVVYELLTPETEHAPCEPTMRFGEEDARGLMDALWAAGIRPSNEVGSEGEKAALMAHLADLRRLVFDAPKVTP